jgi:hypothetical protein
MRYVTRLASAERREIRAMKPGPKPLLGTTWGDSVVELLGLQGEYQAWLDALPGSLVDSATADALRVICDLDLSELASVEPPRGFGRD